MAERAEMSISAMFLYASMLIFRMLGLMISNVWHLEITPVPLH